MEEKPACPALLCFGGSFNPIHYGHLRCARAVALARGFNSVCLVPSAKPPHKPRQIDLCSATDRLEMCRVAVEGDSLFEVSDIELKRAGPSYTLDTVLALKSAGRQDIHWLIGADMLQMLPKWHRAEELVREATILVMARPGFEFDWALLPAAFAGLRHNIVEAPLVDISATEIRRRVRAGLDISELTPPAVVRYIQQRGLYR